MRDVYFIIRAVDMAIRLYTENQNDKDGYMYNSFLVVIIRLLVLIYGKDEILNTFYNGDDVAFVNIMKKYGMPEVNITLFLDEVMNFYKVELENKQKCIKEANPYFKSTLKYVIDMFVCKKNSVDVSLEEEEEFLDLIYTSHTTNPYRISYFYLMDVDSLFFEKYYYSKLNKLDVTREMDFSKTITSNLNLEALNYVGVNLSNIKNMSDEEIEKAKNKAYQFFQVDATSSNRDKELQKNLEFYKLNKNKITSGNGFVDFLLLLSVIVTSISSLIIIIFS